MKRGYILLETIMMLFVLAFFSLFFLNMKKDYTIREQELTREKTVLLSARENFLKAMTEPIEKLKLETAYNVETVSTAEVKIYLKENDLFRTLFVLRRN